MKKKQSQPSDADLTAPSQVFQFNDAELQRIKRLNYVDFHNLMARLTVGEKTFLLRYLESEIIALDAQLKADCELGFDSPGADEWAHRAKNARGYIAQKVSLLKGEIAGALAAGGGVSDAFVEAARSKLDPSVFARLMDEAKIRLQPKAA